MRRRALILGWCGGVGTAVLGLVGRIADRLGALYLLDRASGSAPAGAHVLDCAEVDPEALERIVRDHAIDEVIELADIATGEASAACARRGVDYLSASIQGPQPTLIATRALLQSRPQIAASHLVGAGMNPGTVNALALIGIAELARRTRTRVAELGIVGIHVTELDTTTGVADDDAFAMSWSPEHALDELLEPQAMHVAGGSIVCASHRPLDRLYAARCGDQEIHGMLVPHEELFSIGARFPTVESAFFYAVPAARRALLRHPERAPRDWPVRRLYPPHTRELHGSDRVGVLIATRSHGELWIGFEHDAARARAGWCNGTTFQAAAGVIAGWELLGTRRGIHTVDELDIDAYRTIVEGILGAPTIHHVHVPPRDVASRAC